MSKRVVRSAFRLGLWTLVGVVFLLPIMAVTGGSILTMFLKIEGVPGDSVDKDHKEWIELQSCQWGISRPVGGTGSSRTNGPVAFTEMRFDKKIDKATPLLLDGICQGKVYPKVEIHLRSDSDKDERQTYMKIEIDDCLVSSIGSDSSSGSNAVAIPQESLSLNFAKIEVRYTDVDLATGATNADVSGSCAADVGTP